MSIESRSTQQPRQPSYPQRPRAHKAAMAFIAVVVSSTLVGGMLSMFEMRSAASAMAQGSIETAPSTAAFAMRKAGSGPRG